MKPRVPGLNAARFGSTVVNDAWLTPARRVATLSFEGWQAFQRRLVHFLTRVEMSPDDIAVAALDELAREFVQGGYRCKPIIRLICNSQTYQRSMDTSAFNAADEILFSHARARLLTAEQLKDAIASLPDKFKLIFLLKDVQGLSNEEIGEIVNMGVPAVKSRLLRARLQLREKLTRYFKRKGDDAFAYM